MFSPSFSITCALGVLTLVSSPEGSLAGETSHDELSRFIAGAKKGDRTCQGSLYRLYAPELLRRATRLLARRADAEDALQDAFVEAFRDLYQLEDTSRFGHWLHRILTHQVYKRFRKRKLLARLGLQQADDAALAQLIAPEASPELKAQCMQVDRALRHMPAAERLTWALRYVEGCQLDEIADLSDASLATVKRRLKRASVSLQRQFEASFPTETATEDAGPTTTRSSLTALEKS